MEKDINIDKDCPQHGNSEIAINEFWKRPLTCHWACHCELGESPRYSTLEDLILTPSKT
jgi:hypothetical protein